MNKIQKRRININKKWKKDFTNGKYCTIIGRKVFYKLQEAYH
jgi:hypothetical protein